MMRSLSILLFFIPVFLLAQNKPGTKIHIKKAKGKIKIDGVLDEADWQNAQVADNWYLNFPVDTIKPTVNTVARVTFDDEFLYASFECEDDETPDIITSLRRDFDYPLNDNVGFVIGPYNDFLNGFFFVVTPAGVQMEGVMSGGGAGEGSFNTFWDNKWYSEVVREPNKWTVEMAIPFKSFRYKSDLKTWNIAFDRQDLKRNEKSSWIRTPIQFNTASMAFAGQLVWDDPIPEAKTNISLIPYIAGNRSVNKLDPDSDPISDFQAGFDAKIGVTPSMNLDLTFNPDFSQVEVDQQVLNLTRFEVQFPERRQFFLENSDLFADMGFPMVRPFFSRRIGLAQDTTGLFRRLPILYGARLSGSLNEDWRLSVLNMQTNPEESIGLPAQNYTVATVQRNLWQQSSVSLSWVNKQSLGVGENDTTEFFHPTIFPEVRIGENGFRRVRNNFNRVLAADVEIRSKDNKWYHSSYFGKSFDPLYDDKSFSMSSFWRYASQRWDVFVGNFIIQDNFNAEVGFVPGLAVYPGQIGFFSQGSYKHYPKEGPLVFMGPAYEANQNYIPGGTLTDQDYLLTYEFRFKNTTQLALGVAYTYQQLTFDFNPTFNPDYDKYLAGEEYDWNTVGLSFQSDTRKTVNLALEGRYGGLYNGTRLNLSGTLNARYQPYGNISLVFDYNRLDLPENYGKEDFFLIGPRIDLTLTDAIFLTTYFQYNSLIDNINLNARFQWRYQPASDFFIVYTENYFPQDFMSKNRALVFKLTYWLNL
ncbi:MAG: DUF5916 domain-containing protein [Bacteroidota bacterium]